MKQKILKRFRHADLHLSWIISFSAILIAVVLLFFPQKTISAEDRKLVVLGMIIMFGILLNPILWNFKRRAISDPVLNNICINSVEDMRPYIDRIFMIQNMDTRLSRPLYLYSEGFGVLEEDLFITFYSSDVDYFIWVKQMDILKDQQLRAVTFFEKDGVMGYKFWTLNSKDEYMFTLESKLKEVA